MKIVMYIVFTFLGPEVTSETRLIVQVKPFHTLDTIKCGREGGVLCGKKMQHD